MTVGSAILAAGHVTAALILHRILALGRHPGRATAGVVLYLLSPAFWLLPWGQLTGSLFGPPVAAWHFSQYAEGIYLPLAFLAILFIRQGARARVVVPLLLLLLATKDSAFFFVGAFWIVWTRYDRRTTIPVVAMGIVYIVILNSGGHPYPEGVPTLFPAFAEGVLAKHGWAPAFAGA